MRKMCVLGVVALSVSTLVTVGGVLPVHAGRGKPDVSITFYRGTITQMDPASWTLTIKTDEGAEYTLRVARFADLRLVAVGDRVEAEVITTWEVVLFLKKIPLVPQAGH